MRVLLFTATVFLSACLLFVVEPMVGKMILPLLGGTPAVWNTCLLFFQFMLLLGYTYAHLSTRWLSGRGQIAVQVVMIALAAACLPLVIRASSAPPAHSNPIGWLLVVLAMSVGVPFAVVSATAPLTQKWLGRRDPYFLYGASNVGSMIALLSYPTLIEPFLALPAQRMMWTIGFAIFAVLIVACAISVWWRRELPDSDTPIVHEDRTIITSRQRLNWLVLSAVPSSYLLGVTTYLTTDVAAVPLLWVIPLALYLLSFAIAFGRRRPKLSVLGIALPIAVVLMSLCMTANIAGPVPFVFAVNLAAFFISSLICNCELARQRPQTTHLTEYYLLISIGGVIGGAFNTLLAPILFTSTAEYPIAVVLACMLAPNREETLTTENYSVFAKDFGFPLLAGVMTWGLFRAVSGRVHVPAVFVLIAAIPLLVCFAVRKRSLRFALAIGAVLFASSLNFSAGGKLLEARRSFFGVHRVVQTGAFNVLYHGSTVHGQQHIDPITRLPIDPTTPLTYYTRTGPIGQAMSAMKDSAREIAVVGLGAGSIAAYADANARFTFFEIDPEVVRIADQSGRFSFISAARQRGAQINFILGDARLTLRDAPTHEFDLLILDAFSGDSIPIHLLTREALATYQSKITDRGAIAFHISNLFLNLEPVLASLAEDAHLKCLICRDLRQIPGDTSLGKSASVWVIMARSDETLGSLENSPAWHRLDRTNRAAIWTDDYSNIFSVLGH